MRATIICFFPIYFTCTVCRDLALVLDSNNSANAKNSLVFSNGKTTILLPGPNSSSNSAGSTSNSGGHNHGAVTPVVATASKLPPSVAIVQQGKNNIQGGIVNIQHLCEYVDCNKLLFGK